MLFDLLENINKRGIFKLKSGKVSNNYFNLRELFSQPKKMKILSELIFKGINIKDKKKTNSNSPDRRIRICPIPMGAIPLASLIAFDNDLGLIIPRPEKKNYGLQNIIDGNYKEDDHIIVIEDVITSGGSINEILEVLKEKKLSYEVFVVFDRECKKDFSFPYRALYTRTQFMKDKLKKVVKEKNNTFSNNFSHIFQIAIFIVDRKYDKNDYWKIMQYSKYYNFLVLSIFEYEEEKYDLYYGKLGDDLVDKNSLILEFKEQIEAGVKHVGYFEEGNIVVDDIKLKRFN